ncbi:SnoaL-like domain-containing protein [Nakamurella panacisegetis]|uniref:SnoaL-like domain-containing protein n=1 Tax=Nakamurella panacisegetis TaxID=1090615 RepID=A0A1H0S694_9ACTN|nr:nuclear transport factor 2 family protein [Nakamurella panacisegetis]SDP36746.1 SnoaL-like domain-containing protein [Nakamurella panacisegetis]
MTPHVDQIATYFTRASGPDLDTYLALFAEDAVVEDEAHQHRGVDAIRTWRSGTPSVRSEVLDTSVDGTGNGQIAHARISGDFPGSPVVLAYRFHFDDSGHIASLSIRLPETS